MNYVFDIGNVLLYFKPLPFLRSLWDDRELTERLYENIFCSVEWRMLDEGSITYDEATGWFCHRAPDDAAQIRFVMRHWLRCMTPKWEMVELLQEMKGQGKKLFYLSNMHSGAKEYLLGTYPFFKLFDGGMFSCDARMCKPDVRLYDAFCREYGLEPASCLFTDDVRVNVQGAEAVGMKGSLFVSAERFRDGLL